MSHIWRDDLARADAAALMKATGKSTYSFSGARGYTINEVAALVAKATGKPLSVAQVPVEGLVQGMIGAGVPEGVARVFASFDANTEQGGLFGDAADYKALVGAEPRGFEDWLAENAKAFAA